MTWSLGFRDIVVTIDRAVRRRVKVIKLTASRSKKERRQGTPGNQQCHRKNHKQHTHRCFPSPLIPILTMVNVTTVRDDSGISIAAIRGCIIPAIVRPPATTL